MNPKDKLKEIEDKYEAPYLMTDDTAWLIARVKRLEAALEQYKLLEDRLPVLLPQGVARKALEGEDE